MRAAIRGNVLAERAFQKFEQLYKFQDNVCGAQDAICAAEAERALALGLYDRASSLATRLWHAPTRDAVYVQAQAMRAQRVMKLPGVLLKRLRLAGRLCNDPTTPTQDTRSGCPLYADTAWRVRSRSPAR